MTPIKSKQKYRIRMKKTSAKQPFHFVVIANNNEIILTSEKYARKHSALHTARQLIRRFREGVCVLEKEKEK